MHPPEWLQWKDGSHVEQLPVMSHRKWDNQMQTHVYAAAHQLLWKEMATRNTLTSANPNLGSRHFMAISFIWAPTGEAPKPMEGTMDTYVNHVILDMMRMKGAWLHTTWLSITRKLLSERMLYAHEILHTEYFSLYIEISNRLHLDSTMKKEGWLLSRWKQE